jgi:hypothetical protein
LAILFTFALGTATGDLMAKKLGLGYLVTGLMSRVSPGDSGWTVLAFWIAYILTRPLAARRLPLAAAIQRWTWARRHYHERRIPRRDSRCRHLPGSHPARLHRLADRRCDRKEKLWRGPTSRCGHRRGPNGERSGLLRPELAPQKAGGSSSPDRKHRTRHVVAYTQVIWLPRSREQTIWKQHGTKANRAWSP